MAETEIHPNDIIIIIDTLGSYSPHHRRGSKKLREIEDGSNSGDSRCAYTDSDPYISVCTRVEGTGCAHAVPQR